MRVGFCAANVVATVRTVCFGVAAGSPAGVFDHTAGSENAATSYQSPNAAAPASSPLTAGGGRAPADTGVRWEALQEAVLALNTLVDEVRIRRHDTLTDVLVHQV